jgi:hypothetical protein
MHLLSQSFTDTQMHAHVGAPICFGVTLTPVTPAVADRFTRLSAKVIDSNAATAELTRVVASEMRELQAAKCAIEPKLAVAKDRLAEAQRLAAMPVLGTETETIGGFINELDAALAEPAPATKRLDLLRTLLSVAMGIDVAAVTAALDQAEQEKSAIKAIRDEIAGVRQGLVEAAKVASDPATLAGLDKIRENVKLTRAVTPERVASLQKYVETTRSMLAELESEVAALAKAVQ